MTMTHPLTPLSEFETLENSLPEEFTAELINGRILVTPAPNGNHDEDVIHVADQIRDGRPDLRLYHERGLTIGAYRDGRARVDGAVAPRGHFRGKPSWADTSGVLLVLEVTSGKEKDAEVDRVEKRDAYAESGIPVYLLVDRLRQEVVVHWRPVNGRYTHQASAVFGEKLSLPEPFDFDLDTSELV